MKQRNAGRNGGKATRSGSVIIMIIDARQRTGGLLDLLTRFALDRIHIHGLLPSHRVRPHGDVRVHRPCGLGVRRGTLLGDAPATACVLSRVGRARRGFVGEGRPRAVSTEDRGGDMVSEDFACGAPRVRSEKYAGREARLRFLEVTVASGASEVIEGAGGARGVPYERRR
jgi:hypothetical protein